MKYGILGGTFDPPHLGHIAIAEAAKSTLELDEVIWIPAGRNPLKTRKTLSARHRMAMVELAVADHDAFSVSDIEISRGGPSFTFDTVEELQMVQPGEYWLILGTDAMRDIEQWKKAEKLAELVRFAVIERPGNTYDQVYGRLPHLFSERMKRISMPTTPISSSNIREGIHYGRPVEQWLEPAVWQYINENGLYID